MLNLLAHAITLGAIRGVLKNLCGAVRNCFDIIAAALASGAFITTSFALPGFPSSTAIAMEVHEITDVTNSTCPTDALQKPWNGIAILNRLAKASGTRCIATDMTEVVHVEVERRPIGTAPRGAFAGVSLIHLIAFYHGNGQHQCKLATAATGTSFSKDRIHLLPGGVLAFDATAVGR